MHGFSISNAQPRLPLFPSRPPKLVLVRAIMGTGGHFGILGVDPPQGRKRTVACTKPAFGVALSSQNTIMFTYFVPSLRLCVNLPGGTLVPSPPPLPSIPSLPVIVPSGPVPPLGLRRAVGREGQLFRARELWYLGGPGPEVAPPGCGTSGPHPQQGLLPSALTSNLHLCGQSHRREGCRPQRSLGWVCARLNLNLLLRVCALRR